MDLPNMRWLKSVVSQPILIKVVDPSLDPLEWFGDGIGSLDSLID